MDCIIAIQLANSTIVAVSTNQIRSIIKLGPANKTRNLTPNTLLVASGDPGDCAFFSDYIQKNCKLYEMRTQKHLSTKQCAHFTRREIANNLRKRQSKTDICIAGTELYWIDYLGTIAKVNHCAHGYAQYFTSGLLDSKWHNAMSRQEGIQLLKECAKEMSTRFAISLEFECFEAGNGIVQLSKI